MGTKCSIAVGVFSVEPLPYQALCSALQSGRVSLLFIYLKMFIIWQFNSLNVTGLY